MASYHAIATVGQSILGLLTEACPRTEFPTAGFALYQAKDFQNPMAEGLSLYLHRVDLNQGRRHMPDRIGPDGKRYKAALPLDLHYLLTAWAPTAVLQHHLLGWAMRVVEDTAMLPAGLLNRFAVRPDTFGPDEGVEVVLESISMQDLITVWEVAKPNVQISATYVARLVPIDSAVSVDQFPPVQTRDFEAGAR